MDHSNKPKTSSASSSSSSSSFPGHNVRIEKMVEVVKKEELDSSSRRIQKADREKIRRDKLNEQFLKLGDALDPNRPKSDKVSILNDTIQMLKELMTHVDRLKAEYATLSQESHELIQEKSELREEKLSLKSDIEILNAQYQQRVRTTVPWIPHYSYTIPVVAIPQAPISIQSFPLYGTQNPTKPCSNFIPHLASVNPLTEQALFQHPSSSTGSSSKQDSKCKSLDLNLIRNINYSDQSNDHKDHIGLELELKIHASSSAQENVSGKEKKGNSITTASSSNDVFKS